jgi:ABC transport system ATP-binding/permease protein
VEQRGEGVTLRKPDKIIAKTLATLEKPLEAQARRKLTFKDKHALETLPATMDKLAAELKMLETKLADAGLFTRDPKAFEKASIRHAAATDALSAAEEKWLELEVLREEMENSP